MILAFPDHTNLLLLIHRLLLLPLFVKGFVLFCNAVSFLVLQSSRWGRASWLLYSVFCIHAGVNVLFIVLAVQWVVLLSMITVNSETFERVLFS